MLFPLLILLFTAWLVWLAKQRKDDEEQVDDVQVKLQGSVDVLLWAELVLPTTHQHLRVVHQELSNINQVTWISQNPSTL